MNLIIWNCRGCNGGEFRRIFRAILDGHKPPLVVPIETKMQSHLTLLVDFAFTNMLEVASIRNLGGIVILWDENILEVDDISITNQKILAMIKVHLTHDSWLFSSIHASNFRNDRKILWENLKTIKDNYEGQWLVGGDLNEIMNCTEKNGGRLMNASRSNDV